MEQYDIYKDIAERTGGNIYIGERDIMGLNQKLNSEQAISSHFLCKGGDIGNLP